MPIRSSSILTGFFPSLHRIELVLEQAQHPWRTATYRFPSDFEAAFTTATQRKRLSHARRAMLLAVLVYNLFLLADYLYLPNRFFACLVTRLTLSALIPPLLWLPLRKSWQLETLYSFVFIPFAAAIVYFYSSSSELMAAGQSALVVMIMYVIAFVRPRFPYVASATVFCVLSDSVFMALNHQLDLPFRVMFIGLAMTAGLVSLLAVYALEREERFGFLLRLHIETQNRELAGINQNLAELSLMDSLTGIPNRRFLDMQLADAWHRSASSGQQLSLLMIDLDHFKALNDLHGHAYGDTALRMVARVLHESIRGEYDLVARYGGEEFVVILPNRPLSKAIGIGERICAAIRGLRLPPDANGNQGHITVSVGVATQIPESEAEPEQLIQAADSALYSAKRNGRNQVFPKTQAA